MDTARSTRNTVENQTPGWRAAYAKLSSRVSFIEEDGYVSSILQLSSFLFVQFHAK
jgi:hypothetical protein